VDHVAFLAKDPKKCASDPQEQGGNALPQLSDAKLFQIFLKDPDDVTIELNFLGEVIEEKGLARKRFCFLYDLKRNAFRKN